MTGRKKILALVEAAAFCAGGAVFVHLLRQAGLPALRSVWDAAGPALALAFCLYPLMSLLDTAAWRQLFPGVLPPFRPLYWIRIAGEAVNNLTPGLDIGGEPLKIKWLSERQGIERSVGTSSVILAKTSMLVSEIGFIAIGLAAGWTLLPWPEGAREGFVMAAAVVTAVILSLVRFQRSSMFGGWSPSTRDFYGKFAPQFMRATALNLAGWLSGCVELWVFAHVLGNPISLREAVVLESLVQLVRTASFFIPANIGTQEVAYVFLAGLMGRGDAFGIALSLLKRSRQLVWTAAGFGVWAGFRLQAQAHSPQAATRILDTDLDRWIHRPPARLLARLLARTPLTPNAVTLLSLAPAFLCATLLTYGQAAPALSALVVFYFWTLLDHADGELARLQKKQTPLGRMLDDVCDLAASTIILVGLWLGLSLYWNAQDKTTLSRLFYPALMFNTLAGLLAMAAKRDSADKGIGPLDWLAGREPFYFCLILACVAFGTGHPAVYAFLGAFLILGQLVLFLISLAAFLRRIRAA